MRTLKKIMKKNKFVVLGGGTAGWMTALVLKQVFPNRDITLVQSKNIGIIGVGEATTPHIVHFLKSINIDPFVVLQQTNGTFKAGISFENWNGDGKSFFHGFDDTLVNSEIPGIFSGEANDVLKKLLIDEGSRFEDFVYQTKISVNNKLDLNRTGWGLHFDAHKFASYLENIGRERGINVIEEEFVDATLTDSGDIKALNLTNDKTVSCDFVFDCTGFSRLLIGKLYQSEWISFAKHLPMKRAMPFWLEPEDDIKPYTRSIAMKHGWIWQIPLEHRIGAGYIFDSDYISDEEALAEAEEYFQRKLTVNKIISFEPGRFKDVWIKNCCAMGLSANFIEPIESTSLWLTITQLELLRHFLDTIETTDVDDISMYNKIVGDEVDEKLNFVYLHYLTKRTDSKFWKEFSTKTTPPTAFIPLLTQLKKNNLRQFMFTGPPSGRFPMSSFLQVGYGLEIFEKRPNITNYENIQPNIDMHGSYVDAHVREAPTHREMLNILKTMDFSKKGNL
jgi:tryptophan 7-halogenase